MFAIKRAHLHRAFIVMGVAGLLLAAWLTAERLLFLRDSRLTSGEVVSSESKTLRHVVHGKWHGTQEFSSTVRNILVHYEVDARPYTLETGPAENKEGARVEVRYARSDPSHAEVVSLSPGYNAPILLSALGATLVFFGRRGRRGY
jgi:hypothetical protein